MPALNISLNTHLRQSGQSFSILLTWHPALCLLYNLGLYFIFQNIIKVGSALLDPGNKEHWEQIQRTEGGTAHLLRHYEEYFNNVAQNMKKTYLRPFVIVATNMSEYLCWKLPFFSVL